MMQRRDWIKALNRIVVAWLLAAVCICMAMGRGPVTVNLWCAKNVAPSDRIRLVLNTQNAPVVHLLAAPIDGKAWIRDEYYVVQKAPAIKGEAVIAWDTRVARYGQEPNPNNADTFYSRQINLPKLKPGVYLIRATAGNTSAWSVVNVTNLAVVVKRSYRHALVWVTDALSGALKPGAKVTAFRSDHTIVASGATGLDGALLIPLAFGNETFMVSSGDDLAGVSTEGQNPNGRLITHFQTDRPIYRPGQTVSFKAILRRTRDQSYEVLGNKAVTVELRDPKDDSIDLKRDTTNSIGSVQGTFELPSEAMPGSYSLVVHEGRDATYQQFEVAEYRKPEFQATISPVRARYLAGEKVSFNLLTTYFFGSPVPNATVKYQIRTVQNPYWATGQQYEGDGNLYARDTYGGAAFSGEDVVQTDGKGRATITFATQKDAPDSNYLVTATIIDASRRQVQASGAVPVYAAAKRIGLSTNVIVATLGSLIPIELRVVDLDGAPSTAHVHLKVWRTVWDDKKQEEVEHMVVTTEVLVPPTGKLRYSLPAREAGDLSIEATCDDGTGRKAFADLSVEVAGNFGKNQMNDQGPTIGVRLDRSAYVPGDTAHAFVTTNRTGRPLLLVEEGQDVWGYRVVRAAEQGQLWNIPTTVKMSSHTTVTACEWVKGQMISSSALLSLPDPSRRLSISIVPDRQQYEPGDKASMKVKVRDYKGRPVSAEVSLSVVDESIYAVSPDTTADPYETFWDRSANQVTTAMSAPEELSGGAYQGVPTSSPVRSRFADTALWAGLVATNSNGEAVLKFEMPANLTTWRATAYGVNLDTQVGKGMAKVLANRPVMLRLATPRQMVVGDRLTLIGTVNNRTDSEHNFKVKLAADGVSIQGSAEQLLSVPAKGEGHVEWVLNPTKLPSNGLATLTGEVSLAAHPTADMGDALRLSVPITPKAVRQRILTGGVLGKGVRFVVNLPADRAEPASMVDVTVKGSLVDVEAQSTAAILSTPRYGTPVAINQLIVATAAKLPGDRREVSDSMAMLARDQTPSGWSWWEGAATNPTISARALRCLTEAKAAGLPVYQHMYDAAVPSLDSLYSQINLWDSRALIAAALADAGSKSAGEHVDEVMRRGVDLSPCSRIRIAEAEFKLGHATHAKELLAGVMKLVSEGAQSSYVPVGNGLGWTASSVETTAEALSALVEMNLNPGLQAKFARWLALSEDSNWHTLDDMASTVRALAAYTAKRPAATTLGHVTLTVNGVDVPTSKAKVGQGATAHVPRDLLRNGENQFVLGRAEEGEVFYSVDALVFVPRLNETTQGVRVLRRIEVQNEAGMWTELARPVKAGEPVRITMVAWGDDLPDAMRVSDPIPAGFEFVSDESEGWGHQEVRDGAVIHYLTNDGQPQTFRYYIRAESEGRLTVLPATAEFLRRPTTSGQTNATILSVQK